MMKILVVRFVAVLLCITLVNTSFYYVSERFDITSTSNANAKTFTGVDVIKDAHSFECLDYEIVGVCVYMLIYCCWGVKFYFRDQINHNLPDMVVSSFEKPGLNPWKEIRSTYGSWAKSIQNSSTIRSQFDDHGIVGAEKENKLVNRSSNSTVHNKRFHEANVIGSPAPAIIRNTMKYGVPRILGAQYICKSNVTRYKPYFMSEPDTIAWRKPELEINQQWRIPGLREIGSKSPTNLLGNTWGKVVPRTGYVLNSEPSKAAAVVAQRSVDIVTQKNQIPHIYQSYGTSGGSPVYQPTEIDESNCDGEGFGELERDALCEEQWNGGAYDIPSDNEDEDDIRPTLDEACPKKCYGATNSATWMPAANEKKIAWQMLVPVQTDKCEAFGSASLEWAKPKNNEEGEYAWNYWREYECCKPAPGILIYP